MNKKELLFGLTGSVFLLVGGICPSGLFAGSGLEQQGSFSVPGFDASLSPSSGTRREVSQDVVRTDEDVLTQAERHYQSKRFFEAEKIYSEYVRQNAQVGSSPDLALAYHRLGMIAKKRQLYDKAQQYLIAAIQADPNKDPQITLDYAIILYEIGEYERAKNLLLFLDEHAADLEDVKIYLGKTLLEIEPSLEILPLLEAEYGRADACELLAVRCREAGKTSDAEQLEKMLFSEKVKEDQVFFAPPAPVSAPAENEGMTSGEMVHEMAPSEDIAVLSAPADGHSVENQSIDQFAGLRSDLVAENGGIDDDVPLIDEQDNNLLASSAAVAREAAEALSGGNLAQPESGTSFHVSHSAPTPSEGDLLRGFPGLAMNDATEEDLKGEETLQGIGIAAGSSSEPTSVGTESIRSFSEMDKMANQVADRLINSEAEPMAEDLLRSGAPSFAEAVPEDARTQKFEEDYSGFDGYRLPVASASKRPESPRQTDPSASLFSFPEGHQAAPVPDPSFVSEICTEEPEKVALQPIETASPATVPQSGTHRFSSEEKLEMARKAGAEIRYLTPEEYNNEIATRAGKVVKQAEEEISKSRLDEDQKNDLLQKIFGK